MTDLAHEVMTPTSFSSTAPIHAFIVDEQGRVRDYAALTGRVNIDRTTGEAVHQVVDSGTCHQRANLGPGADQAVVFGPFLRAAVQHDGRHGLTASASPPRRLDGRGGPLVS
jgi:hypothetical protein